MQPGRLGLDIVVREFEMFNIEEVGSMELHISSHNKPLTMKKIHVRWITI
jgi:hypothetical protein